MLDNIGKLGILAVIIITAGVFLWTRSEIRVQHATAAQDTFVDEQGRLHVFHIVLGSTKLRTAETLLKSRSDTALYLYPQKQGDPHLALEAFFPSLADHSKVILGLQADNTLLTQMRDRATLPRMYPDGIARMNLANSDLPHVQQLVVDYLVLVPSIKVKPGMLAAHFGNPSSTTTDTDGNTHYRYPRLGLEVTIRPQGKDELRFKQPGKQPGVFAQQHPAALESAVRNSGENSKDNAGKKDLENTGLDVTKPR
jgi:hypothetical protein